MRPPAETARSYKTQKKVDVEAIYCCTAVDICPNRHCPAVADGFWPWSPLWFFGDISPLSEASALINLPSTVAVYGTFHVVVVRDGEALRVSEKELVRGGICSKKDAPPRGQLLALQLLSAGDSLQRKKQHCSNYKATPPVAVCMVPFVCRLLEAVTCWEAHNLSSYHREHPLSAVRLPDTSEIVFVCASENPYIRIYVRNMEPLYAG